MPLLTLLTQEFARFARAFSGAARPQRLWSKKDPLTLAWVVAVKLMPALVTGGEVVANLAKVGVEGSNPFARSINLSGLCQSIAY